MPHAFESMSHRSTVATALRRSAGRPWSRAHLDRLEQRTMLTGDGFERFDLPADDGSSAVVVGDFNGDGMMDVATANAAAGTLSVMLNSPVGFEDTVNYEVGGTPSTLALPDINEDNTPDLVTFDSEGVRLIAMTNNGSGEFADHGSIPLPAGATYATVAHLNRDGSMEVIASFAAEDMVRVYYIVDTGNPEAPTGIELKDEYVVGDGPVTVTVGDVNGDGAEDLVTANPAGSSISVLMNVKAQLSTGDLVGRVYKDLVGRFPTEQEMSDGIAMVEANAGSAGTLAEMLVNSEAFVDQQIRQTFTRVMWRDPSDQEMQTLGGLYAQKGHLQDVVESLLSSDEYFESRASSDLEKFVHLVYADGVGRPIDAHRMAEWLAKFDAGMTRPQFVAAVVESEDYQRSTLRGLADRFLHRQLTEDELETLFGDLFDDHGGDGDSSGSGGDGGGDGHSDDDDDGDNSGSGGGGDDDDDDSDDDDGRFSIAAAIARVVGSEAYLKVMSGGTGHFGAAVTTTVGAGPSSVAINEVNGDGKRDLVVANTGADTVSILLGKGDGVFEAGPVVNVGDQPVHTFGFFKPERGFMLASVNRGDDTVSGHLVRPDGTVDLKNVIRVGDQPSWAAPGIFSSSGHDGMAVANAGDGTVTIITFDDDDHGGDSGGGDGGSSDDGYEDVAVPDKPDLHESSDLGDSHSDNITRLNNSAGRWLKFKVSGVEKGVFVNLFVDGIRVGNELVRSAEGFVFIKTDGFTVLADGEHKVTATVTDGGREGRHSEALTIIVKTPRVEVNNTDPNEPTNNDGKRARARVDEMGRPIVTIEDDDGGMTEYNLHDLFDDSPSIDGDLVVMDEVKHRYGQGAGAHVRRYAAGQSSQGLLLYYNNDDGSWGQRNLTADIAGAEAFASDDLDVLTTPWGNSNIFGKNGENELVAYWQDGSEGDEGFNWHFVNLGEHLSQTGQQQPGWNGDIESYSVPWGGMNVIAVDANGDVTAVWWAPGLDHWVYSNLSEITGAEKLVGTVSVSVTPWGGVNVLGTNALGHTIALWWAPGYEWQVTNMTLLANAPDYAAGSASSFSSIAGDIVVAGLTEAGNVAIFRWTLDDQAWNVTEITPPTDVTSELVGQLTGYANMNSELFVLGNNVDGEVVQFAFDAASDEWNVSVL
ncbi:MAG: hypothetical protein GIKADHBN_00604 [Phycisphaerales bacterium]|nr:hypothetical protein [Phycisphaerales bacterium]